MKSAELVIHGRKVCGVGYRPFLLLNAIRMGIGNFYAYNIIEGGEERVVAQLYGDEGKINRYIDFVRSNYPKLAEVDRIEEESYEGEVIVASEFLQILQFEQINKGIPLLISIDKKQDIMIGKQDIMIGKQDIMIGKQDIMIGKQDIMIDNQESTIDVLRGVKEDTAEIRADIAYLRNDTSETLYEKYEQMSREIAEIKATLSEIKAKVA